MQAIAVAVIGAGPAGAAATEVLADAGLPVTIFDEQPRAGGNVGRIRVDGPPTTLDRLAASNSQVRLVIGARVLQVGAGGRVEYQRNGAFHAADFRAIVLACGAYDLHYPLPGVPAPGVSSAGSLQALLKSQGIVPSGDVVIAGSGPFLYVAASDLAAAGANVRAVVDRFSHADYSRLALPGMLIPGNAIEYLRRRAVLLRHGVSVLRGQQPTAVDDGNLVLASGRRLAFDHLGLTELMVPQTQLPRTSGCGQAWSASGGYFVTRTDSVGRTSADGVYVCGEGQGIRGWRHAKASGILSARACLADLGMGEEPQPGRNVRILTRFANTLERTMRRREPQRFEPEAILCACEKVTVEKVQQATAMGLDDLSSIKVVTRCGMGPCQGRYCEPLMSRVVEQAGNEPRAPLNQRVLSRPITAETFANAPAVAVDEGESAKCPN